jgi:hypothetical protein
VVAGKGGREGGREGRGRVRRVVWWWGGEGEGGDLDHAVFFFSSSRDATML